MRAVIIIIVILLAVLLYKMVTAPEHMMSPAQLGDAPSSNNVLGILRELRTRDGPVYGQYKRTAYEHHDSGMF